MAGAHVNLGAVYNTLGRHADAIRGCTGWIEIESEISRRALSVSRGLSQKRQTQRAKLELRLLEPLNPELARELQLLLPK